MSITLLAHTKIGSPSPATSSPISTVGATCLVIAIADIQNASYIITDTFNNTWNLIATYDYAAKISIYEAHSKGAAALTLGASHTVTVTNTNGAVMSLPVLFFSVWNGTKSYPNNPVDQTNVNHDFVPSTINTGSITPSVAGTVSIGACASTDVSINSINSGFTLLDTLNLVGGNNYAGGLAYLIQGAAATVNPMFTLSAASSTGICAGILNLLPGGNYTVSLSETYSLVESIGKKTTRSFSEILVLADVISKRVGKSLNEILGLIEVFHKRTGKSLAESIDIVEIIAQTVTKKDWSYIRNHLSDPLTINASGNVIAEVLSSYEDLDYLKKYL